MHDARQDRFHIRQRDPQSGMSGIEVGHVGAQQFPEPGHPPMQQAAQRTLEASGSCPQWERLVQEGMSIMAALAGAPASARKTPTTMATAAGFSSRSETASLFCSGVPGSSRSNVTAMSPTFMTRIISGVGNGSGWAGHVRVEPL